MKIVRDCRTASLADPADKSHTEPEEVAQIAHSDVREEASWIHVSQWLNWEDVDEPGVADNFIMSAEVT